MRNPVPGALQGQSLHVWMGCSLSGNHSKEKKYAQGLPRILSARSMECLWCQIILCQYETSLHSDRNLSAWLASLPPRSLHFACRLLWKRVPFEGELGQRRAAREPRGDTATGWGCCSQHRYLLQERLPVQLPDHTNPTDGQSRGATARVFAVCQDRLARKRVPPEAKPEIKGAWLIVLAAAAVHPGAEQPGTRLA